MAKRIEAYPLAIQDRQTIAIRKGATPYGVFAGPVEVIFYALVDTTQPMEDHIFRVIEQDTDISPPLVGETMTFIGACTASDRDPVYVFHAGKAP